LKTQLWGVALSALLSLVGCGEGAGGPDETDTPGGATCGTCQAGYTCQAGVCTPAPASAKVTVAFPNLFDQGGTKVLPTYISHVVSSSQYPLAAVTITNTGGPTTVRVSVGLPTYGSTSTQTVTLNAGEIKVLTMSPVIDFARLFDNTTALPAAISVDVASGSNTLFAQSFPIQISGRNTVFWTNGAEQITGLVAAMVTPQDKARAIDGLIRGAANRFPSGSMVGYQGASWPAGSMTIAPGQHQTEAFQVLAGERPRVSINSVTGGTDNNFGVYIMDAVNYTAWVDGFRANACAVSNATSAGTQLECATAQPGVYYIVYHNPSDNFSNRTVTRERPMLKWEVTYYQSKALFEELRARGLVYVNLPGTGFFSSAQNVRYPAESLSSQSANCIDGSILFAAAWEALGMEPLLGVSFQAGHAIVAVRCWSGESDCFIPVETTMVGGSASFSEAWRGGVNTWRAWSTEKHLQAVDIKQARTVGLTPAPM